MSRTSLALAASIALVATFAPASARAQGRAGGPAAAPARVAAAAAAEPTASAGRPGAAVPARLSLARPLDLSAPASPADGRGIEDATRGVWIGGAVGALAGGLIASWAYCTLGEGDCGFSFTAAGPGVLIGAILGASVGGLLDDDGATEGSD